MNIQNQDNFFTADARAIKKIKIFCSCSRFKTIPQLFSTIGIVSVVVTIEQQTMFRSNLLFQQFKRRSNELEQFYSSSSSSSEKNFFRVQVRQNDRVLSSSRSSSQPCSLLLCSL